MSSQNPPRRPKGTPVGGQFAPTDRPESDVDLGAVVEYDPRFGEVVNGRLTPEGLLLVARRQATRIASKVGKSGDPADALDDYQQDMVLRLLEARARQNAEAALNGATFTQTAQTDRDERKYAAVVGGFVANLRATGQMRYEDRTALKALGEAEVAFAAENGRAMTRKERDELAEQMRAAAPSGRRPTAGFQNVVRVTSVDFSASDEDDMNGAMIRAADAAMARDRHNSSSLVSRESEKAQDLLDQGQFHKARAHVWNAVGAAHGAPSPVPERLSEKDGSTVRAAILKADGGALGAANRFLDGKSNEAEQSALFAPFTQQGSLPLQERVAIAETLAAHPDYADDVFSAAVSAAVRRRKPANV